MNIVLICRNNQDDQLIIDKLAADQDIELTTLTDTANILDSLADLAPDMVITDLILQGIDGMEIVDYVAQNLPTTKSVIISEIADSGLITNAISKGASYYFIKPVNPDTLAQRLKEIATTKKSTTKTDEIITNIFLAIGIPPHIKGYSFLREAIKKVVETPDIMNKVTKGIYPHVAKLYDTTPSKVERAIRHAIEVGWNKGRHDAIASVFGTRAYVNDDKPTNSEFIALVAEYILFRMF